MLFNSYIFIFVFLPIVLIGWYTLNKFKLYEPAKYFLAGMSLWFYGYFNYSYLLIIISSIVVNYLLSFIISKMENRRKIIMWVGVVFNLGLIFYFKYYDFFFENINAVFKTDFVMKNILLPLGISFFTFQQLSFIIDRGTGKANHYSFSNYITFVTFFPQLIAGPIVFYSEIIPQFENKDNLKFNKTNFEDGIFLFVIGLGKKVLLADVFALVANYGFSRTDVLDTLSVIIVVLSYTFELYFDFSGYCDMATGLSRMFNIILPINFNSPYKSCTIKEFWQRWHITLSRFFVNYVYIPLGGSRKGKARTVINTFVIFLLSGLWHGAAWTYIAWGAMNGILMILDNSGLIGIKGREEKKVSKYHVPACIGWIYTFVLFNLSLFFFRSETMTDALCMFKNLFTGGYNGRMFEMASVLDIPELYIVIKAIELKAPGLTSYAFLVILLLLFALSFIIIFRKNALQMVSEGSLKGKRTALISIVFVWSVISLSQVSTFLYFNF